MALGDIKAGRAFVELFAKDNLDPGLKSALAKLRSFGTALQGAGATLFGIGAGITAALGGAVAVFASTGDAIDEMSQRTGFSAEALSELGHAAALSGGSMEDLEIAIKQMQKQIGNASKGSEQATKTLAALGVPIEQLAGLEPEKQFALIADGIAAIEDPTLRAAAALSVFGRSGMKMLPLIGGGAAGLAQLRQQAAAAGATISTTSAQQAGRLSDALDSLRGTLKQITFAIGEALVKPAQAAVDWLRNAAVAVLAFAKANAGLVQIVAVGALALAGLGAALFAAGTAAILINSVITLGATLFAAFMATIAALPAILAFAAANFGLIAAAVGAATAGLAILIAYVDQLWEALKNASDAIIAGDWSLALQTFAATLKLGFMRAIAPLEALWLGFREVVLNILDEIAVAAANNAAAIPLLGKLVPGDEASRNAALAQRQEARRNRTGDDLAAIEKNLRDEEKALAELMRQGAEARAEAEEGFRKKFEGIATEPKPGLQPGAAGLAAFGVGAFSSFAAGLLGRQGGQQTLLEQLTKEVADAAEEEVAILRRIETNGAVLV
jgi:hypothetical protein